MSEYRVNGQVTYHVNPPSACNYHRVNLPMQHMGPIQAQVPILFYNRMCMSHAELAKHRAGGFRIVIDMDDDIQLGKDHVLYEAYKRHRMTEQMVENLRLSDVCITTNSYLAWRLKPYHNNIVVVPNALPFDEGQFTRTHWAGPGHHKVVYAGGASHFEDLKSVLPVVPRDELTLVGFEPQNPEWRRIHSLYPFAHYRTIKPTDGYMANYDGFAISFAALTDTVFNRCKSNLKTLEAGAKGLAFIATRMHPYDNTLDKGTILTASSKAEWRDHFKQLLADEPYRQSRAELLAAHVRKHYALHDANIVRRQIFEGLR